MESIKVIERWSKNPEFLPYVNALEEWDEIIGNNWNAPHSLVLDPTIWLKCEQPILNDLYVNKIIEIIEKSFERIEDFQDEFEPFLNHFWRNLNNDMNILINPKLKQPIENFKYFVEYLRKQQVFFEESLVNFADLGLFRVDCFSLKKHMIPIQDVLLKKLENLFLENFITRFQSLKAWLSISLIANDLYGFKY